MNPLIMLTAVTILVMTLTGRAAAHGEDGPVRAEEGGGLPDWLISRAAAAAQMRIEGRYRLITGDGYPDTRPGAFPNAGNPHRISRKDYNVRVPARPRPDAAPRWLRTAEVFGISTDGVLFEGLTAEFWQNDRAGGWNYYAYHGGCRLGLDHQNAHVQPDGTYHYHGVPTGIVKTAPNPRIPVLIGYAADGFPLYGPTGYADPANAGGGVKTLRSSYAVKSGERPDGPGGRYSGAFVEDYGYVAGRGDLDECNGRFAVTPEYPDGTYHYVATEEFPNLPLCWKGRPDRSLARIKSTAMLPAMGPRETRRDRGSRPPPRRAMRGRPPGGVGHGMGTRHRQAGQAPLSDQGGGQRAGRQRGGPCQGR